MSHALGGCCQGGCCNPKPQSSTGGEAGRQLETAMCREGAGTALRRSHELQHRTAPWLMASVQVQDPGVL